MWQFVVSCARWLELDGDAHLVCEGVEDIDTFHPLNPRTGTYSALYEQLKDFQAQSISAGDQIGRELIANFASKYVEDVKAGNQPRFRLVTTATCARQRGDVDLMRIWSLRTHGEEPEETFLTTLRKVFERACVDFIGKKEVTPLRAEEVQNALDWFDEEGDYRRWVGFLDAVEWHFEQDDFQTSYDTLLESLARRENVLLPKQMAERLIVELLTHVSQGKDGNQRFDRQRLEGILTVTQEELETWVCHNAFGTNLFEFTLKHSQFTRDILNALSEVVGQSDESDALLHQLISKGLLEAAPFGLTSDTPVWDDLKLHTRATLNFYPLVRINDRKPLPRDTVQQLGEMLTDEEQDARLFILKGEGGSGKSTALFTCATTLLEDPESVVVVLNLNDITEGTSIEHLVPGAPHKTPDLLLSQALKETGRSRGFLIIDQLDRLSRVSASNEAKENYFAQIKQVIMRTLEHDDLRVVVACRSFDAQEDSRIEALTEHPKSLSLSLEPLAKDDVEHVVRALGYTLLLTPAQLDILSIPLHLHLLAGLGRVDDQNLPLAEYQLYERYWEEKRRHTNKRLDKKWNSLHQKVCKLFVDKKRRYVTEVEVAEDIDDLEKLVSEDIFRRNKDRFVYFHQRYEEYVFAKYFDGSLLEYIHDEDQSFLALDQAKAILIARRQRSDAQARYIEELRAMIFDAKVQTHYNWLVRGQLSTQSPLLDEEFTVWREMMRSDKPFILGQALSAVYVNAAFVDAFKRHGWLEEVLMSGSCAGEIWDESALSHVRISLVKHVLARRPEEGASWVSCLVEDPIHFSWLRAPLQMETYMRHRVVFDAFIKTVHAGLWESSEPHRDGLIYELPDENFEWIPEIVVACMHHNLSIMDDILLLEGDYVTRKKCKDEVFTSLVNETVLSELAIRTPCTVITHFVPVVVELIEKFSVSEQECGLWTFYARGSILDYDEVWLQALFSSLETCEDFSVLEAAATSALSITNQSSSARMVRWRLLVKGRLAHLRQALKELEELLDARRSLWLPDKYETVICLLQTASSKLPPQEWHRILGLLVEYVPNRSRDEAEARDYQLFPLLYSLEKDALTEEARTTLEDLSNRLPESARSFEFHESKTGWIDPIDPVDFESMDDEEVVDYLCNVEPQATGPFHRPDKVRTLEQAVSRSPARFVKLLTDNFEELPPTFRIALIRGWAEAHEQKRGQETAQEFSDELWAEMTGLVLRVHEESPDESVSPIISLWHYYPRPPDETMLTLIMHVMLHHSDPAKENWDDAVALYRATINCVRGRMAELLGKWVGQHKDVFDQARDVLTTACQDPSTQVRAGIAFPLLMSLNYDRDFAISRFMKLVEGQPDELLATCHVMDIMQYGLHSHLDVLAPVIECMLHSDKQKVREFGGCIFAQSTFVDATRLERLQELVKDAQSAKGVACVWVQRVKELSPEQSDTLVEMFNHPSDDVLRTLASIFNRLTKAEILERKELLNAYLKARIIHVARVRNIFTFGNWSLSDDFPEMVLDTIERVLDVHQKLLLDAVNTTHSLNNYEMSEELVKLYQRHKILRDRVTKVLDRMIKMGIWTASRSLQKLLAQDAPL